MKIDLSNNSVLITGSTGGIGKALCHSFAKANAKVILHFNKQKDTAKNLINSLPGDGHSLIQADLSNSNEIKDMVDSISDLDIVINNAALVEQIDMNGMSIKSCSVFAAQAEGAEITTIEGLGSPDGLHVLQEMFKEHHGLQCGYCTPGMITRAYRLLQENSNPTEEEVRFGMSGNLCRCTGYQNIVKAIMAAADKMNEVKEAAQ